LKPLQRRPLADLFSRQDVLFDGVRLDLPTVLVYSNIHLCGDRMFARSTLQGAYRARSVGMAPVVLGRLPPGTMLLGGNSFLVQVGDALADEQIFPLTTDLDTIIDVPRERIEVAQPCLLVARYGENTWGHWLAELLPRAVLAERAYPGRFTYVVPAHTTEAGERRSFATSVLESLAAYGIPQDRLLRLRFDSNYSFADLHAIGSLWSHAVIHPGALEAMRTGLVQPVPETGHGKLALLRRDAANRTLHNGDEVFAVLEAEGFAFREMAATPFIEQVAAFRGSERVFGVLGSGLTGLMFAPDGVKVLTAAPANWFDCYFYMLMQLRDGRNAEIRGHSLWDGTGLERDAPLVIDPRQMRAGLAALERPWAELAPRGDIAVAGLSLPRRLGPCVFEVNFSAAGNAAAFLRDGWSVQEPMHIFSVGTGSALAIPPLPEGGDYVLELSVAAFTVAPYLTARRLDVAINGILVATADVAGPVVIGCDIPPACLAGAAHLEVRFGHPVCPPAAMLGAGADTRQLGIAFFALRVRTRPSP
jgi:hypothetical protein